MSSPRWLGNRDTSKQTNASSHTVERDLTATVSLFTNDASRLAALRHSFGFDNQQGLRA